MTLLIMQAVIEAVKAAIIAGREADNLNSNAKPMHAILRSGSPALRQLALEWKVTDKYQELCHFKVEVKDIYMTDNYNMQESEKVPVLPSWLGRGAQVHATSE